jgi:nucleoside-diphosphate-sugar epimerase
MSSPQTTVAIFGATGGTGLAALKFALSTGSHVNVLARTPSKLSKLFEKYPSTLHITTGDIRNPASLKSVLTSPSGTVVDTVISSIGMVLKREGLSFGSDDPTVCYDATKAILSALSELEKEGKVQKQPTIVLLSTTGISSQGRDVPLAMMPLYHWMLSVPHEDKKNMENLMVSGEGKNRKWVLVRPSFLVDGDAKGVESLRASVEVPGVEPREQEETAVGYTVRREDVGLWIVEECVKKDGGRWVGKMVTLTY